MEGACTSQPRTHAKVSFAAILVLLFAYGAHAGPNATRKGFAAQPKIEVVEDGHAELDKIETALQTCLKSSNGDARDRECQGIALESLDKHLNSKYNASLKKLKDGYSCQVKKGEYLAPVRSDSTKTRSQEVMIRLIASERAWIKYRDSECHFEAVQNLGGTLESMTDLRCQAHLTKDRVLKIDEIVDGEALMCGEAG